MVWVIAFGELFFGDLWCVVWGYGGMRTHFSLLNPYCTHCCILSGRRYDMRGHVRDSAVSHMLRNWWSMTPSPRGCRRDCRRFVEYRN